MRAVVVTALIALAAGGCAGRPRPAAAPRAPAWIIGQFTDDYGGLYNVTAREWLQHPNMRFHIVRWNAAEQFLVARNDSANPTQAGLWTRIDWVALPDMAPWTWGFCYSAYDAPTMAVAETTSVARRDTPRTGCNGHPFSRMRAAPRP